MCNNSNLQDSQRNAKFSNNILWQAKPASKVSIKTANTRWKLCSLQSNLSPYGLNALGDPWTGKPATGWANTGAWLPQPVDNSHDRRGLNLRPVVTCTCTSAACRLGVCCSSCSCWACVAWRLGHQVFPRCYRGPGRAQGLSSVQRLAHIIQEQHLQ